MDPDLKIMTPRDVCYLGSEASSSVVRQFVTRLNQVGRCKKNYSGVAPKECEKKYFLQRAVGKRSGEMV